MKTCSKCKTEKPRQAFYNSRAMKDGKASWCKACEADLQRERAVQQRAAVHKWSQTHPERVAALEASKRARAARHEFDRAAFLAILENLPPVCPVRGVPFERGKGCHSPNSPSVDRVDPDGGYVRNNMWPLSYRANALKGRKSLDEMGQAWVDAHNAWLQTWEKSRAA